MMTVIFERETEIGHCNYESGETHGFRYAEPEFATIFAHTIATLNGAHGILKIEQHCFLRHGGELPDQPWVKPEVRVEAAGASKSAMVRLAESMHHEYAEKARAQFPQEYLV